jgi:hypothetical protein
VTVRNAKDETDLSYRSSPGNKEECIVYFRLLSYATASLRISFSSILRPNVAYNCLMRFKACFILEAGRTTGSLVPTATKVLPELPCAIETTGWRSFPPRGPPMKPFY